MARVAEMSVRASKGMMMAKRWSKSRVRDRRELDRRVAGREQMRVEGWTRKVCRRAQVSGGRVRVRKCYSSVGGDEGNAETVTSTSSLAKLELSIELAKENKKDYGNALADEMKSLRDEGVLQLWSSAASRNVRMRNVFVNEIKRLGIKDPESIAKPSVRNDAAFLFTTVGVTSVVAVAGGFLPVSYILSKI